MGGGPEYPHDQQIRHMSKKAAVTRTANNNKNNNNINGLPDYCMPSLVFQSNSSNDNNNNNNNSSCNCFQDQSSSTSPSPSPSSSSIDNSHQNQHQQHQQQHQQQQQHRHRHLEHGISSISQIAPPPPPPPPPPPRYSGLPIDHAHYLPVNSPAVVDWSPSTVHLQNRPFCQFSGIVPGSFPTKHISHGASSVMTITPRQGSNALEVVPHSSHSLGSQSFSDDCVLVSPVSMGPPAIYDAEQSQSPEQCSASSSVFSTSSALLKKEESATTISNSDFPGPRACDNTKQMEFPDLKHDCDIFCEGERIVPDIHGHIEKNVFYQENAWTCYRRNYISLQCQYTLTPNFPGASLYMFPKGDAVSAQIKALGVRLSASMDEGNGKSITLVQHTAKRDHGPQNNVKVHKLAPSTATPVNSFQGTTTANGFKLPFQFRHEIEDENTHEYTVDYNENIPPTAQHTFERIQFKQATQNNGRRRANQQFYHLTIELLADIRKSEHDPAEWVRIAHRVSEAMVVRGRSPGHYKGSTNEGGRPSGGSPGSSHEGPHQRQYGFGGSDASNSSNFGSNLTMLGGNNSTQSRGHASHNQVSTVYGNGLHSYVGGNVTPFGVNPVYGPISGGFRTNPYSSAHPSPTHSHSASSTSLSSISGSANGPHAMFPSDLTLNDQEAFAIDAEDDFRYCASSTFPTSTAATTTTNANQAGNVRVLSEGGSSVKADAINRLQSPGLVLGSTSTSPAPSPTFGKDTFNQYRSSISQPWNMNSYGLSRFPSFDTGNINYGSEGLGAGL